jgi:AraC-like DNA-binding protein
MVEETVSHHYLSMILDVIDTKSASIINLMKTCKIPVAALNNKNIRVSKESFVEFVSALQNIQNDESLGYYIKPQRMGTNALLIDYMSSAYDVKEAIKRAEILFKILDNGAYIHSEIIDDKFVLSVNVDQTMDFHWIYEEFMARIYRIIRWLSNERITITNIKFPFAKVDHVHEYKLMYGTPAVEFDQEACSMEFSLADLKKPIVRTKDDLRLIKHNCPSSILLLTIDSKNYVEKVRLAIKKTLPEKVTYEIIAKSLAMHPQTLRRRLTEEGAEFTKIKDTLYRDLSNKYLLDESISIKEIAYLLDFSAPSSFARTFKRWYGMSPKAYRELLFK